jgi:hypothetical protein
MRWYTIDRLIEFTATEPASSSERAMRIASS